MARIMVKKRSCAVFDDEVDSEELGMETEAEKQMKVILGKQLNTHLSMKEQFAQHRTFVSPSTYKSLTELVHGTCSHDQFKAIEEDQEVRQELQRCGLAEDEVAAYVAFKSGKETDNRLVNPEVWREKVERIEATIKVHNENLSRPQGFSNATKKLNRHEMELEKTLYAGCNDKRKLAALTISLRDNDDRVSDSFTDSAFAHVKEVSGRLLQKCRKNKKRKEQRSGSSLAPCVDFSFDSNIHHVVVPLGDEEVCSNRLSLDQIREIPRFQSYNAGKPSKVLYIKNLHSRATERELRSIFGRFEDEDFPTITYKICTGRMKGQAFVTFQDVESAEKALHFANGFVLREKPIVIEFGKKSPKPI